MTSRNNCLSWRVPFLQPNPKIINGRPFTHLDLPWKWISCPSKSKYFQISTGKYLENVQFYSHAWWLSWSLPPRLLLVYQCINQVSAYSSDWHTFDLKFISLCFQNSTCQALLIYVQVIWYIAKRHYLYFKYTMYPWSLQANLFMGGKCTFVIHIICV